MFIFCLFIILSYHSFNLLFKNKTIMKNIIIKLRDWLILWIGIVLILWITNARTWLKATSEDILTSEKWNELVDKVDSMWLVKQIVLLTNSNYISTISTSFVHLWNLEIWDVKSWSKIIWEVSISTLWQWSEEQEWGIFKDWVQIASLKHKNSITTGWGMHHATIMFEDTNPNIGNNTYALKLRVNGNAYFNYPTTFWNSTSFAKLTEISN